MTNKDYMIFIHSIPKVQRILEKRRAIHPFSCLSNGETFIKELNYLLKMVEDQSFSCEEMTMIRNMLYANLGVRSILSDLQILATKVLYKLDNPDNSRREWIELLNHTLKKDVKNDGRE